MKRLTIMGLVISTVWLGAFALILFLKFDDAQKLGLNEWGDFLSGATAPLALFWLVIGYFLQGEELRLNTAALRAQEEQLSRQVAETATLAANSERQARAAEQLALATKDERERAVLIEQAAAQPLFRPRGGHGRGAMTYTTIANVGATVTKVSASTEEGGIRVDISPNEVFEGGTDGTLQAQGVVRYPYKFSITYTDYLKQTRTKNFEMTRANDFREIQRSAP